MTVPLKKKLWRPSISLVFFRLYLFQEALNTFHHPFADSLNAVFQGGMGKFYCHFC